MVRRAGMLAVGFVLLWCASAQAGTYEVWSCANADGKPVPADGWRSEGYGYFSSPSNDCAGGNGLYAGLNGAFPHVANTETTRRTPTRSTCACTAPRSYCRTTPIRPSRRRRPARSPRAAR